MKTIALLAVAAAWVALATHQAPEPVCPPEETRPAVYEVSPLLVPEERLYDCLHALATRGPGRECA